MEKHAKILIKVISGIPHPLRLPEHRSAAEEKYRRGCGRKDTVDAESLENEDLDVHEDQGDEKARGCNVCRKRENAELLAIEIVGHEEKHTEVVDRSEESHGYSENHRVGARRHHITALKDHAGKRGSKVVLHGKVGRIEKSEETDRHHNPGRSLIRKRCHIYLVVTTELFAWLR